MPAALEPTPTATLIERQGVLGDLLAELTERGMRFDHVAEFLREAVAGGYRMHYTKGELSWETEQDLRVYFADMAGPAARADDCSSSPAPARPLPDIVCRCGKDLRTRARDSIARGTLELEIREELMGLREG